MSYGKHRPTDSAGEAQPYLQPIPSGVEIDHAAQVPVNRLQEPAPKQLVERPPAIPPPEVLQQSPRGRRPLSDPAEPSTPAAERPQLAYLIVDLQELAATGQKDSITGMIVSSCAGQLP